MSLPQIAYNVELTAINCGECGGTYAINERYRRQQYEKSGSWTCPYCKCGWGYSTNNENARLKRQLEQEKQEREWERQRKERALSEANSLRREVIAQKSVVTKLRKRVKAGVCPVVGCKRHFENLEKHIATVHPGFK